MQYPTLGNSYHFDIIRPCSLRLPLLKGEEGSRSRKYLFVGIGDFFRELYAGVYTDKTQYSTTAFLYQQLEECPYTVEYSYSDNGTEYKGTDRDAYVARCREASIGQKFTRYKRPQTNGKAERVIRTLMDMWHRKERFRDRKQRQVSLLGFINFYNTVKPHEGIDGMTLYEKRFEYFYGFINV